MKAGKDGNAMKVKQCCHEMVKWRERRVKGHRGGGCESEGERGGEQREWRDEREGGSVSLDLSTEPLPSLPSLPLFLDLRLM